MPQPPLTPAGAGRRPSSSLGEGQGPSRLESAPAPATHKVGVAVGIAGALVLADTKRLWYSLLPLTTGGGSLLWVPSTTGALTGSFLKCKRSRTCALHGSLGCLVGQISVAKPGSQ